MITNKIVPHIDGLSIEEAHKGGGFGGLLKGATSFFTGGLSDVYSFATGGSVSAYGDPLDIAGTRAAETARNQANSAAQQQQSLAKAFGM